MEQLRKEKSEWLEYLEEKRREQEKIDEERKAKLFWRLVEASKIGYKRDIDFLESCRDLEEFVRRPKRNEYYQIMGKDYKPTRDEKRRRVVFYFAKIGWIRLEQPDYNYFMCHEGAKYAKKTMKKRQQADKDDPRFYY